MSVDDVMERPAAISESFRQSHALIAAAGRGCLRIVGVTLLAAILSGCGNSSNGRLAVSGAVTLDGNPLDNGVITFQSIDKKLPTAGATVLAGKYQIPAEQGLLPGKYFVAIDSADASGVTARPDHQAMEIPVSRIPLRYNGETELTAEVSPSDRNNFEFSLQSDHRPSTGQAN